MFLLLDIGGTHTRIGLSEDGETLTQLLRCQTPETAHELIPLWKKEIAPKLHGADITAAIVGVPGSLSKDKMAVVHAPALPGWEQTSLYADMATLVDAPVYFENRVALAGLGEAVYGAGRGEKIVQYLSIGTSVGGVRIVDGYIDVAAHGFEPGRQLLFTREGALATLESLVSQRSLEKRFGRQLVDIHTTSVWDEVMYYLAIGLTNTMLHWSPQVIILGGAIAEHHCDVTKIRQHMVTIQSGQQGTGYYVHERVVEKNDQMVASMVVEDAQSVVSDIPYVVPAELGSKSVFYGALSFCKSKLRLSDLMIVEYM